MTRWAFNLTFRASACAVLACASWPALASELTEAELSAEAKFNLSFETDPHNIPISIDEATDIEITILADSGFVNASGDRVIDLIENDNAYLAVEVQNGDGRPVQGARPSFSVRGKSRIVEPGVSMPLAATDESGIVEFGVVGGEKGMDIVTVTVGDVSQKFLINVLSHEARAFPLLGDVNGGLNWTQLTSAKLRYEEGAVLAEFSEEVSRRSGETVRLTGFMMPLDANLKQRRFLLTSFPPSCFFHIPGGATGVVEVFASSDGIENSYSPILIEGEFEAIARSDTGVIYQMREARLVDDSAMDW